MAGAIQILHGVKTVGIVDQDLVKAQAEAGEVLCFHLLFGALHPSGNLGILRQGAVNGDELVSGKGRPAAGPVLQGHHTQVFRILPGGHNPGIPHSDGLFQGGMRVAGHNEVDALHLFS